MGLAGYDYNILLTAFYVAVSHSFVPRPNYSMLILPPSQYVAFELPCQWANKKLGVAKMISVWTLLFGLFSFVMTWVNSFGAGIAVRFRKLKETLPPS